MILCLNPVISRRAGVALLVVGILGMLARVYIAGFKDIAHGNVVDFSFGLFLGLGIALCFVRDWNDREEEIPSIKPS